MGLGSIRDKQHGELNRLLEHESESLLVSLDNLELVMSQAAPIVAIDGVIAFVRREPTIKELETWLEMACASPPPAGQVRDSRPAQPQVRLSD